MALKKSLYCVHMYVNGKMIPVEIISGIGGRRK
jgi:hypothetical protein